MKRSPLAALRCPAACAGPPGAGSAAGPRATGTTDACVGQAGPGWGARPFAFRVSLVRGIRSMTRREPATSKVSPLGADCAMFCWLGPSTTRAPFASGSSRARYSSRSKASLALGPKSGRAPYAASTPGSGANRSSTRPTRCSQSAATTRSRSRTSPAPPASPAGWCTTTSAAAKQVYIALLERLGAVREEQLPPPVGRSARARVADDVSRWLEWTEDNRTIWLGTLGRGEDIADPDVRRVVTDLVGRAVALVAARHADLAQHDSPRLRYALECWTGLNRAATRRWLQGQASREATHELIASTLEHVLRTFGAPPKPKARPPKRGRG